MRGQGLTASPKTVTGGPASPWPGVSRLARLAGGAFRRGRDETPKSTRGGISAGRGVLPTQG